MPTYLGVATDEVPQLKIGAPLALATTIKLVSHSAINITPASVAAATTSTQAFALPGVLLGDIVAVTPPAIVAGVAPVCARVTGNDSVSITFLNATAGPLVPSAGVYQVMVLR